MLPDWAPGLTAWMGHAPVLLLFAIVLDLIALAVRRWEWGPAAASIAYVATGVAAVVTYYWGMPPVAEVYQTPEVAGVLDRYGQYSWYAMLFGAAYGLVRLGLAFAPSVHEQVAVRLPLLVVAIAGMYVTWQAHTFGAELVYAHGVGVEPVAEMRRAAMQTEQDSARGLSVTDTGWTWTPASPGGWKDRVEWVDGSPTDVQSFLFEPEGTGETGLALQMNDATVLFTLPGSFSAVEVTATLNLDGFDGPAQIVHHVRGASFYDYLQLEDNQVRLARREGSAVRVHDTGGYALQGWRTYRLVADRTRFRAFVGDEMVAAGTDTPASAGTVGLRFSGSGLVRIRTLSAGPVERDEKTAADTTEASAEPPS